MVLIGSISIMGEELGMVEIVRLAEVGCSKGWLDGCSLGCKEGWVDGIAPPLG